MRNRAIDFMKFAAVVCIFNAHSTMLYPAWPFLSTGGYVGDALFFFCSGFTLLMDNGSHLDRFDTWYKRRLSRIWPSCLAWGVLAGLLSIRSIDVVTAFRGIGWFIRCILVFYVAIWFIGRYFMKWIVHVFVVSCVLSLFLCFLFLYTDHTGYWGWAFFFPVMLFGAVVGRSVADVPNARDSLAPNMILCLISFFVFTGVIALGTRLTGMWKYVQLIGMPLILSFVWFAYKAANSDVVLTMSRKRIWKPVLWVGGLCLDFYLVKWSFISGALNFIFPFNLPIMLVYLLAIAYLNRTLGRIIQQTISQDRRAYDWKAVFAL